MKGSPQGNSKTAIELESVSEAQSGAEDGETLLVASVLLNCGGAYSTAGLSDLISLHTSEP